jgi:hypothetical protein
MRRIVLIGLVLSSAAGCRKQQKPAPPPIVAQRGSAETHGCKVTAEVVPEFPERSFVGDHVYAIVRVTTECEHELEYQVSSGAANQENRPDGDYRVTVKGPDGERLPEIPVRPLTDGSIATGWRSLRRGEPIAARLDLSQWVTFTQPGRHELVVIRTMAVRKEKGDEDWLRITTSTPLDIQN